MAVNKPPRGKYALLALNWLTSALRLGSFLFTLALLFVLIVSVSIRKINELSSIIGSPFHPETVQGTLSLLYLLFVVFSTAIEALRLVMHKWLARFPEREQYLLTWKKLWQKQTAIISGIWNVLQIILFGLGLVIFAPVAADLLESKPGDIPHTVIAQFVVWVQGSELVPRLVLCAIITFFLFSFIVRLLAHNQPREENIISVKGLELVHRTLDVASNHLQALSTNYTNHALEAIDAQIIQGLAEKMLESLQQEIDQEKKDRSLLADALEQEKKARSRLEDALKREIKGRFLLKDALELEKKERSQLEKQVKELLQQGNTASIPAPPVPLASGNTGPKLNHLTEHDDSSAELIG